MVRLFDINLGKWHFDIWYFTKWRFGYRGEGAPDEVAALRLGPIMFFLDKN